jgi:hypothetical protein
VITQLEEASSECAAGERQPLLTFVVAGGALLVSKRSEDSTTSYASRYAFILICGPSVLVILRVTLGVFFLSTFFENLGEGLYGGEAYSSRTACRRPAIAACAAVNPISCFQRVGAGHI